MDFYCLAISFWRKKQSPPIPSWVGAPPTHRPHFINTTQHKQQHTKCGFHFYYTCAQFHLSSPNLMAIEFKRYNMQGHVCTFEQACYLIYAVRRNDGGGVGEALQTKWKIGQMITLDLKWCKMNDLPTNRPNWPDEWSMRKFKLSTLDMCRHLTFYNNVLRKNR